MLLAMVEVVVSSSGASPVTVTVSCSEETCMSKFNVTCAPEQQLDAGTRSQW